MAATMGFMSSGAAGTKKKASQPRVMQGSEPEEYWPDSSSGVRGSDDNRYVNGAGVSTAVQGAGTAGTTRDPSIQQYSAPQSEYWPTGAGGTMYDWANSQEQKALQSHPNAEAIQRDRMNWAPKTNTDGSLAAGPSGGENQRFIDWYTNNNPSLGDVDVTTAYNIYNQNREFGYNSDINNQMRLDENWRNIQDMGLVNRQFSEDVRVNKVAEEQWNRQFGFNETQADREYGLDQGRLAEEIRANRAGEDARRFGNETERMGVENLAAYQQGQLSNDRYSNETQRIATENDRLYQQGLIQNQQQANIIQSRYNEGRLQVEREAQDIERTKVQADIAYKNGQLSLQERNIILAELTQRQQNAFQNLELRTNDAFRRMSLESQERMAQQDRDMAYQTALMQAIGRNQPQNVRWLGAR